MSKPKSVSVGPSLVLAGVISVTADVAVVVPYSISPGKGAARDKINTL